MANIFNIGSVSVYAKNQVTGEYEYQTLYDLLDFLGDDDTINLQHNISFGASFDIIGNHLLIGCPFEEPLFNDTEVINNTRIGSVYVFDLDSKALIQKIVPDNTPATWTSDTNTFIALRKHNFGFSLCSGDGYFVVGAPGYTARTTQACENSGRAYMYKYNATNSEYELAYTFQPNSDIDGNRFGNYVSCCCDQVVIGTAPSVNASQAGYIRYYDINSTIDGIDADVTILNTHIGLNCDLIINDNKIAIGTPYNDTVKIYEITNSTIEQSNIVSNEKFESFDFGSQVIFDGDKLLVGCPNGYSKLGITLRLTSVGKDYVIL